MFMIMEQYSQRTQRVVKMKLFKKKFIIFALVLLFIPFCLADQVLWDDDSDIEVYDTWKDIDGTPLTGADCSWYVYDSDGTINQEGEAIEFSVGIFNFSVNSLAIGIYPLRINCSLGGYNGTSTKDSIKIIDELSEEYKIILEEINQTVGEINRTIHDIYDFLLGDITANLTYISNITYLTYNNTLNLETDISNLDIKLTSLQTYLEDKWGVENAEDIMEKIKDIRRDVTFVRSRYYSLSESEKESIWLSTQQAGREILSMLHSKDKWWERTLIWAIPIGFILLIIIICLVIRKVRKNKKKSDELEPEVNIYG